MRSVGPVALLGGAAALAVAGVGLLLPPGGPRDGAAGGRTAPASASGISTDAHLGGPTGVTAEGSVGTDVRDVAPVATDGPSIDGGVSTTARTTGAAVAAVPPDRLAGPVPDDEIALAFAAAVPAADGLGPDAAAQIVAAARTGLVDWYTDAGWRGVGVQAAVVTQVVTAPPPPGVATASVAALWSGEHPVLGTGDRRYATVTLTTATQDTSTADDPGTTWTVDSIQGGAGDG